MRTAFSDTLTRLAGANPQILLLTGDHGYALFDSFRQQFPQRYINAGIAEQNMVGMAAGLARQGFKPIVYGLSAFVPVRVLEQIKLDVAHDNLPVVFIGDGAGLVYSTLGTSHQSTEDIACTRAIPNMALYSPADRFEMVACMDAALSASQPAYLRMGKADLGDVHSKIPDISTGGLLPITQAGQRIAFVGTGSMVITALDLAKEFPDSSVWSVPVIKPLAAVQVAKICATHSFVVVMEEHSIYGGLGSAVAEVAAEVAIARVLRVGVDDRFTRHCGSYDYVIREHGLDSVSIAQRVCDFVGRPRD